MTNTELKPDHLHRFEKHLEQIQLSRKDDFVIDSMKLTFFAGWAAAMDSLSQRWFEPNADQIKSELQAAVDRLYALEQQKTIPNSEGILDLSGFDGDEELQVSYQKFKS